MCNSKRSSIGLRKYLKNYVKEHNFRNNCRQKATNHTTKCYSQLIINIMYINIPENSKCLKCGAKNFTEMVTRSNQTFKRCRMCGHEKLHSTLTASSNNTEPTIYNSANYNSEDVL